jgi:hypothetical protein
MRIMAEDNLLAVQPKSFVVTTNSDHEFEVYLNLASWMKLTGINQLWLADITYIRLQREFVYLAVILDGCVSPDADSRSELRAISNAAGRQRARVVTMHSAARGCDDSLEYFRLRRFCVLTVRAVLGNPTSTRPTSAYLGE